MTEIKLKDIAEQMGISIVTVSNALSGRKGVSESLRKEIIRMARQLGYDMSRYEPPESNCMIGVLVSHVYLEVGTSFYWAMYQQVIRAAAVSHSLTMLESVDDVQQNKGILPQMIRESKIDGLIIIGWMKKKYIEKILKDAGVPVVLLDINLKNAGCDAVLSGNYIGMYKATRYLLEHGHQRIAFLGTVEENDNVLDRYYGYCKGLLEAGIEPRREWRVEWAELLKEDFWRHFREYSVTAFACYSDYFAGVLYDRLTEHGYRVPEDISVISYDNYLFGHEFAKKLTTFNVDMESMAETAVKILQGRIRGSEREFGAQYVDSHIVERNSVKRIGSA